MKQTILLLGAGALLLIAGDAFPAMFTDVSGTTGLSGWYDVGYGASSGDIDNDGDPDLFVSNFTTPNRLGNNMSGVFADIAAGAGVDHPDGAGYGVTFGDINNDHYLDLFVVNVNAGPDSENHLYLNNQNQTFTNIAPAAGVDTYGRDVNFLDYNRDGRLDIYVTGRETYGSPSDLLYRNNGNNTFTDVTSSVGITSFGRQAAAFDFDNDGDPDILVVSPTRLFRNDGGAFTEVTSGAGLNSATGFDVAAGDYDNDGDLDLYFCNDYNTPDLLYRNNGNGTFSDVTAAAGITHAGWSWDCAFADFNNDGYLDIFIRDIADPFAVQEAVLYQNNQDGTFTDISQQAGVVLDGWQGEGIAVFDYDLDGDMDIFVAVDGSNSKLYSNNGNTNNWITLKLKGTFSNRAAIGARVKVVAGGVTQIREVGSADGQESLPVEFGLGAAAFVNSIEIRWPSGIVQRLYNLSPNQIVTIVEQRPRRRGGGKGPFLIDI